MAEEGGVIGIVSTIRCREGVMGSSAVYSVYRIGSRTLPCTTPALIILGVLVDIPNLTWNSLPYG